MDDSLKILGLLVVIVGACIAYRQMRIADAKLKHELSGPRREIYDAAQKFISKILQEGNVRNPEIMEYLGKIQDAELVLNENVAAYLKTLFKRAGDLHVYAIEAERPSDEQHKAIQKKYDELNFFGVQGPELKRQFAPFLRFDYGFKWPTFWKGKPKKKTVVKAKA
jgi:hypothetical protein